MFIGGKQDATGNSPRALNLSSTAKVQTGGDVTKMGVLFDIVGIALRILGLVPMMEG